MNQNDVPEPWASRMRQRGFVRGDGQPNISALARTAGLAVETVRRAIYGMGEATPNTVHNLVDVLGLDVQTWLGRQVEAGPWQPPSESMYLSSEQRDVLNQLVRVMVGPARRQAGDSAAISNAFATGQSALLAARHAESAGRELRSRQDVDAGASQDSGGMDPA